MLSAPRLAGGNHSGLPGVLKNITRFDDIDHLTQRFQSVRFITGTVGERICFQIDDQGITGFNFSYQLRGAFKRNEKPTID